ncbi:elongator complex protein 3, partial [Chloroflexota bacterium]
LPGGSPTTGVTVTAIPNFVYVPVTIDISASVSSISLALEDVTVFDAEVTVVSADATLELTIPIGTQGNTEEGEAFDRIVIAPQEVPPPPPTNREQIGLIYDVYMITTLGVVSEGVTFSPPITITLDYDESQIAQGVAETALRPAWWDDDGAQWVTFNVYTVNTDLNEIYRLVKRGHKVADVVKATKLLKEHGFKVHYHWMSGLPGSTPEKDLALSVRLFNDARFKPDGLKLYPTMVVKGTELEKWYQDGLYQPYDDETMINLICEIKSIVPKYVRISRVLRDIPAKFITGGLKDSLRDVVKQRMKQQGIECKCIRCREHGHRSRDGWKIGEPRIARMDYKASDGKEIFLSFEDEKETLFGLLRMRIQAKPITRLGSELRGNFALIRELHIYGPEVSLSQRNPIAAQHKGLGKTLLREAERIAGEEFQGQRMIVLSGTGAKEYYRELDYNSQDNYMVKHLAPTPQANHHPTI